MRSNSVRVREWPFPSAPRRLRKVFPEGRSTDWLVHVPKGITGQAESLLLRWRQLYPVRSVRLSDGSTVYWGAPSEAVSLIADKQQIDISHRFGRERRSAVRVPIAYPSRYETISRPKQTGTGRTINLSRTGISFTTESLLAVHSRAKLHVAWPVRFQSDGIVELSAVGTLARAEETKAALKLEKIEFHLTVGL